MAITTRHVGPEDHGIPLTLDEFIEADFEAGWLYELARGVVQVTEVPGIHHGRIVDRVTAMFVVYQINHPGVINYRANASECRLRLPGMQSDRHPDQAIYLLPPPEGPQPWTRWVPQIVVEVVSRGGEERDYIEKREEYLRAGVIEYWILDPAEGSMKVLLRAGDVWQEQIVAADACYRTPLLPGLEAYPRALLGAENAG